MFVGLTRHAQMIGEAVRMSDANTRDLVKLAVANNIQAGHDWSEPRLIAALKAAGVTGYADTSTVGVSSFRNVAVTNAGVLVKSGAGVVYGFLVHNPSVATVFVKFCDAIAVTVGTTPVVSGLAVPAGQTLFCPVSPSIQRKFNTGIMAYSVTGSADANTTAPATATYVEIAYS